MPSRGCDGTDTDGRYADRRWQCRRTCLRSRWRSRRCSGLLIGWGQIAALWMHLRRPRAVPLARPADLDPEAAVRSRRSPGGKPAELRRSPLPGLRGAAGRPQPQRSRLSARLDGGAALAAAVPRRRAAGRGRAQPEGEPARHARPPCPPRHPGDQRFEHARRSADYLDEIAAHLERSDGGPGDPPARRRRGNRGRTRAWARSPTTSTSPASITPAVVPPSCCAARTTSSASRWRCAAPTSTRWAASRRSRTCSRRTSCSGARSSSGWASASCSAAPSSRAFRCGARSTASSRRYARWNVMQHQCAGLAAYLGLLLENPDAARGGRPSSSSRGAPTLALAAGCCASRMATDALAGWLLRGRSLLAARAARRRHQGPAVAAPPGSTAS